MSHAYEIEALPLTGSALVRAHREAFERVERLYPGGAPDEVATFRRAAGDARERTPDARYASLASGLRPSGPVAERQLERVIRERGVVVTAGQQAGLFTGPLYTVYKALSAVRLAEGLERALGLPVLPVFWIASEDHDWEEVSHAHAIDVDNRLQRIEVKAPVDLEKESPPVSRLRFGPDIVDAVRALEQATPDSEFKEEILGPLRAAYRPGAAIPEAFREALGDLLMGTPLCFVEASSPWVKESSRPVLEREWERRRESGDALVEWAKQMEASGYDVQVPVERAATNLFVDGPAGRDRLILVPDAGRKGQAAARLRRSGLVVGEGDVLAWLRESPQKVSPSALLRPVVESFVLPVAASVGGPAEIAYHAQTPPLFELHGVRPPPVVPRASFRIVEARIARSLERTGVSADTLAAGPEEAARALARDHIPEPIEGALAELGRTVAAAFERLDPEIAKLDASLQGTSGRARHTIERALEELRSKVTTGVQRRNETLVEQLRKAAVHLWPLGRPQERVLNVYPYLIRYGRSLLAAFGERVPLPFDPDRA